MTTQQDQLPEDPKLIKHWGHEHKKQEPPEGELVKAVSKSWMSNGCTHVVVPKGLSKKYGLDKPGNILWEEVDMNNTVYENKAEKVLVIRRLDV